MEGTIITVTNRAIRLLVQDLLDKGDVLSSLTAPQGESPFPLWNYKGTLKMWVDTKWINVGEYTNPMEGFRINEKGFLRKTD